MKDDNPLNKILSPEGRWIIYGSSRHKKYIIKKEMPLPVGWRLVLQKGDNPNRWAVYTR